MYSCHKSLKCGKISSLKFASEFQGVSLPQSQNFSMCFSLVYNDVLIFSDKNGTLDSIIKQLSTLELTSILVEAGPKLVNAFLKTDLVDQVIYFEAPHSLGSNGMPWFETSNYLELNGFQRTSSSRIGPDKKIIFNKND